MVFGSHAVQSFTVRHEEAFTHCPDQHAPWIDATSTAGQRRRPESAGARLLRLVVVGGEPVVTLEPASPPAPGDPALASGTPPPAPPDPPPANSPPHATSRDNPRNETGSFIEHLTSKSSIQDTAPPARRASYLTTNSTGS